MNNKKKLKKNRIEVKKFIILFMLIKYKLLFFQVIRNIVKDHLKNCYLVDNNGKCFYRKSKNDIYLSLCCSIDR